MLVEYAVIRSLDARRPGEVGRTCARAFARVVDSRTPGAAVDLAAILAGVAHFLVLKFALGALRPCKLGERLRVGRNRLDGLPLLVRL